MRASGLAVFLLAASATGAQAQDINGDPYYGKVTLSAGFTEDPHKQVIHAGGSVDASRFGCEGMIGERPDYSLTYKSGVLPLHLSAESAADVSLVVNLPNGQWLCDDDSAGLLNPGLTIASPKSGRYGIWIGTVGGADNVDATLFISEIGYGNRDDDNASSSSNINPGLSPTYGTVTLSAGFSPDPHKTSLTPGGDNAASSVNSDCLGNVSAAPDLDLQFTGSSSGPLYIYVESDEDTTLLVNTPSGKWVCDDDSSSGVNPGIRFGKAESGLYDVWVGTFEGVTGDAVLHFSEVLFPAD